VTVDTTNGLPTLSLDDGGIAAYDAAASSPTDGRLVFDYTVAAGDYTTDLTVLAFNPNGTNIRDANGVAADLSGAAGSDLALDVNAAVVTEVAASPQIGEVSAGQKVALTLTLSEGVTVVTAGGSPTLDLSGGGVATYDAQASNPSAGKLVFDYTVGSTDRTPRLFVAQFNANGASIEDANGNVADLSTASAFATNLQVGPAYVTSVTASQTGEIGSGQTIQFTVTLSDAVTLDSAGGMPTLLLNNGAIATYDSAASNPWAGTLIFDYTVGPGDYTTDLKVSGLDLNGAVVRDRNGVEADLSGAAGGDLFVGVNAVTVTG
jgi:hypothetical protein